MPLTDTAIKKAKPEAKQRKLYDERGLFLLISPKGGKWWRFKYLFDGKEKLLSLGTYPDVSLKEARDRRDEARKQVAADIDPGEHRKAQKTAKVAKQANSFEVVAREWYAKHSPNWSANHGDRIIRRLERDIFPWIGGSPVADITAPQLLEVIRRIEKRGALETAHRALGNCGQVFRYAVATGRAERDPSGDLRGALPPVKETHFASVTDPAKVAGVLRALDSYEGTLTVRCALRLAPLVFVRPGELRHARWADIDLEGAEWRYTVTKTNTQHIVPLSRQSVKILTELHPLTGRGHYVFPGARSAARPMSENAILAAMRRMGISKDEMSGHGFRAMARTILDEVLGFRPDYIEHQLAHAVRDPNGRAYNRTAHLPERRKMMQDWADYLDKLKAGAEIISINQHA
ncbi:tyrosine-type recombinase/integrase [Sedimenticola thiotaurini]|uniref:Integrase n=1 Tax=Sedimenticola thiotaurini TaxID=1543721 RepID=A0A0F7JYE4_9GAMM|nr:integrase arm-type DNA-binding domain-containing protein [Sedimenticola thiotaurini]AKH19890.1 integrase [Sedimenticola thiotaurini]